MSEGGQYNPFSRHLVWEFKQINSAAATTAALTEKVWGEYVSLVCQSLRFAKGNTKRLEFKISVI